MPTKYKETWVKTILWRLGNRIQERQNQKNRIKDLSLLGPGEFGDTSSTVAAGQALGNKEETPKAPADETVEEMNRRTRRELEQEDLKRGYREKWYGGE